jgi:hypothetical protein
MAINLPKEEIQKYIALRNAYHQMRGELEAQIQSHSSHIAEHTVAIRGLRNQINQARPTIPGANKLCEKCDVISMVFGGVEPGQSERIRWYNCVICGHEAYET